jgi:hypothetical protein
LFVLCVTSDSGGNTYSGRPNVDSIISVFACGSFAGFIKARSRIEMSPV